MGSGSWYGINSGNSINFSVIVRIGIVGASSLMVITVVGIGIVLYVRLLI